jgi:hypothetical protein
MNIHFKDKKVFDKLMDSALIKIRVGSHLYKLETADSDTDYLIIYANPLMNTHSFYWEHHQLQYKDTENNVDYVFTTVQNFVRNILTGDSTINYEVLFSEDFENSKEFAFLYDSRLKFRNYNIIRSYLGHTKRDIKIATNLKDNTPELYKRVSHIYRSLYAVDQIMFGNFYKNRIDVDHPEDYKYLLSLKTGEYFKNGGNKADFLKEAGIYMEDLRVKLNVSLEKGLVRKYMKPEYMLLIDKRIMELCISDFYLNKQFKNHLLINEIYESLEFGVQN